MSGETRSCSNCGHGQAVPQALGQYVECHGAPPQLLLTVQGPVVMFPQCRSDWLCGVWQRKPVELVTPDNTKPT